MIPAEAMLITRCVRGACPSQKMDEYTPDLWYDLLSDLAFADCRAAVVALGKRQNFISPADIRAEIQAARNERIRAAYIDVPAADANPDDVALWLESVRAENNRIANGEPAPPIPLNPKRPVAELLGDTAAKMPHVAGSSEIARKAFGEALRAKKYAAGDEPQEAS